MVSGSNESQGTHLQAHSKKSEFRAFGCFFDPKHQNSGVFSILGEKMPQNEKIPFFRYGGLEWVFIYLLSQKSTFSLFWTKNGSDSKRCRLDPQNGAVLNH